jgi:hypothetical protein
MKARKKLRDVKCSEQSELRYGECFTHHITEPNSNTIDYFEERIEEVEKNTRRRSGSIWKAHESRKLRTFRRSTFGRIQLSVVRDVDRLVYNYELPHKKALKRKVKKLQ